MDHAFGPHSQQSNNESNGTATDGTTTDATGGGGDGLTALAAAVVAIYDKASHPIAGKVVIGVGVVFLFSVAVTAFQRLGKDTAEADDTASEPTNALPDDSTSEDDDIIDVEIDNE